MVEDSMASNVLEARVSPREIQTSDISVPNRHAYYSILW